MDNEIKSGDHVKLSTGNGPTMVAEWMNGSSEWHCAYWDEDKKEFVKIKVKAKALTKVPKSGT